MQVTVLVAGMVFVSDGFAQGTVGYSLLTSAIALLVIGSTATFTVFVALEVYRSLRYAKLHVQSRNAEAERVERAFTGRDRGNTAAAVASDAINATALPATATTTSTSSTVSRTVSSSASPTSTITRSVSPTDTTSPSDTSTPSDTITVMGWIAPTHPGPRASRD